MLREGQTTTVLSLNSTTPPGQRLLILQVQRTYEKHLARLVSPSRMLKVCKHSSLPEVLGIALYSLYYGQTCSHGHKASTQRCCSHDDGTPTYAASMLPRCKVPATVMHASLRRLNLALIEASRCAPVLGTRCSSSCTSS